MRITARASRAKRLKPRMGLAFEAHVGSLDALSRLVIEVLMYRPLSSDEWKTVHGVMKALHSEGTIGDVAKRRMFQDLEIILDNRAPVFTYFGTYELPAQLKQPRGLCKYGFWQDFPIAYDDPRAEGEDIMKVRSLEQVPSLFRGYILVTHPKQACYRRWTVGKRGYCTRMIWEMP